MNTITVSNSLFELTSIWHSLQQRVDSIENEDELNNELLSEFDKFSEAYEIKVENYIKIIKKIQSDVDLIGNEIKRLNNRKNIKIKTIEYLKDNIISSMKSIGLTGVETSTMKIRLQNNPPSLNILDESLIPVDYKKMDIITKIDARAIIDYLKNNPDDTIKGAELSIRQSLRWN